MRFPIVASLANLKTEDFADPGATVQERKLGDIVITDDAVAALLTQEAKAGRAVYLTVKTVDRLDGTFPIAGMIQSTGVAGQTVKPVPATVPPADSAPPAGGAAGTGTNEGTAAGSGV